MSHVMEFLGHTPNYWLELEKRFTAEVGPLASVMLEEIVTLQGKVAFYESRIEQMATLMRRAT